MFEYLREKVEQIVRDEQKSVYTFLPVIIESIDRQNWTCEVSRKDDDQILANQIPLATAYAGPGYGELHPVSVGDEAFLHCASIPLEDFDSRGHQQVPKHRHHSMRDGVLYLRQWFEDDTLPVSEDGEYVYAHESGTEERIKPDGRYLIQHADGGVLSLTQPEAGLSIPNTETDTPNADTYLGVTDRGDVDADGHTRLGSTTARRARPADYWNQPDAPEREYETAEAIAPIFDPTDAGETTDVNPRQVTLRGPLDAGFFELRRRLPPRRAADPDPAIDDPANPAYIRLPPGFSTVPMGYDWVNVTDNVYRIWGSADAPVDIITL